MPFPKCNGLLGNKSLRSDLPDCDTLWYNSNETSIVSCIAEG